MISQRRWTFGRAAGVVLVAAVVAIAPARMRPEATLARAQSDDAALRELAERLLGPTLLGPGGQRQVARLLPGRLPDALAANLVFPPGSRIVGSVERLVGDDPVGATAVAEAAGTAASLLAFYETELVARGWVSSPFFAGPGNPPGGLQPTLLPVGRGYCRGPRGPSLSVTVLPSASGPSDIRLSLETLFPFGCETFGRGPLVGELLPPLYTPPDVELLPSNPPQPITGGKPALASSDGIAVTPMPPSTLEGYIGEQLASAGWRLLDRGADGPVAWSRWAVPGEGDWRGFLFVVEGPGADQRTIHIQVTTAAAPPR
jgi:hypothetical protein